MKVPTPHFVKYHKKRLWSKESEALLMKAPYKLCMLCTNLGEKHHEPPRGTANKKNPIKYLCRKHHTERHSIGIDSFKRKYPEYK